MSRLRAALTLLAVLLAISALAADEEGLPVQSELVRTVCGACHQPDENGLMSRISYQRKPPEGWQLTLKRMIRTNGLDLTPEQAREIVRYLSDHHGLAPEEERPIFYRAEKRPIIETFEDSELQETCVRCHLGARFMSQRRTEEEWELLKGMHIGYFPVIESQTFRGRSFVDDGAFDGEGGSENDSRWRADIVLDKLASKYPFETPEWKAFRAKGPGPGLAGRWLLSGHEPSKGPVTGVVTFTGENGDYTYSAELTRADGSTEQREGRGVLYGGYSWRGRSNGGGLGELREVVMLSADGSELEGRWFHGTYGELGMDVTLSRLGSDPEIAAVWPRSAKAGAGGVSVTVYGANFGDELPDFGRGVSVRASGASSPNKMTLTLDVADDALPGSRDVSLGATRAMDAFAVYDRIDYVKVLPEEALARVGGGAVPKQFAQFEAAAFHRGPDGEVLTDDDIDLGTIEPEWSLEEYFIRHEDDDVPYVGTLDASGLFTPAIDGPNPERELNANNFGDVWVVASFTPEGSEDLLRGRSRLVVTIPIFVYWELMP